MAVTGSEAEARDHYRRAHASGVTALVIGGGDGTIAHALTSVRGLYPGALPRLAVLKLGTGNAVATAVAAPRASERYAVDLVARLRAGRPGRPLRTLDVGGRLGCFGGFGVDAQLLEDHARCDRWLDRRRLHALRGGGDLTPSLVGGMDFHDEMLRLSGASHLTRMLQTIYLAFRRYQYAITPHYSRFSVVTREHSRILSALLAHDADRAEERARAHVAGARRAQVRALKRAMEAAEGRTGP